MDNQILRNKLEDLQVRIAEVLKETQGQKFSDEDIDLVDSLSILDFAFGADLEQYDAYHAAIDARLAAD